MNTLLRFCLLSVLVVFSGCAVMDYSAVSSKEIDKINVATAMMGKIFDAYQRYNRGDFSLLVSKDFVEDRNAFINEVEEGFYEGQIIEAHYSINKVIKTADKYFVSFRWEKKQQKDGQLNLLTGIGQFVFIEEDGQWVLYQVKVGNLFNS